MIPSILYFHSPVLMSFSGARMIVPDLHRKNVLNSQIIVRKFFTEVHRVTHDAFFKTTLEFNLGVSVAKRASSQRLVYQHNNAIVVNVSAKWHGSISAKVTPDDAIWWFVLGLLSVSGPSEADTHAAGRELPMELISTSQHVANVHEKRLHLAADFRDGNRLENPPATQLSR